MRVATAIVIVIGAGLAVFIGRASLMAEKQVQATPASCNCGSSSIDSLDQAVEANFVERLKHAPLDGIHGYTLTTGKKIVTVDTYATTEEALNKFVSALTAGGIGAATIKNKTPIYSDSKLLYHYFVEIKPDMSKIQVANLKPFIDKASIKPLTALKNMGDEDHPTFRFKVGQREYEIRRDRTVREVGELEKVRVNLPSSEGFPLASASVATLDGDVVVAYTADGGPDVQEYICRINAAVTKAVWCEQSPFITHAALGKDVMWVAGVGVVGAIDPQTGKHIWKHDWLRGAFAENGDSFWFVCPITENLTKNRIIFRSQGSNSGRLGKEIELERSSGRVVDVYPIPGGESCD